jgi:hypothetical protein
MALHGRDRNSVLDDIKREIVSVSGGPDLHQRMRLLEVIQNLYELAPLRPLWSPDTQLIQSGIGTVPPAARTAGTVDQKERCR